MNRPDFRVILLVSFCLLTLASSALATPPAIQLSAEGENTEPVLQLLDATLKAESGGALESAQIPYLTYEKARAALARGGAPSPEIYVHADLSSEEEWRLSILDFSRKRQWIRRIPGPAVDPAAPEALVAILTGAVLELARKQSDEADAEPSTSPLTSWELAESPSDPAGPPAEPQQERSESKAPLAAPDARPSQPRKKRNFGHLTLAAHYLPTSWGRPAELAHAFGLGLGWQLPSGVFLEVLGDVGLPIRIETDQGDFTLERWGTGPQVGLRKGERLKWEVFAAGRIESLRRTNEAAAENSTTLDARARLSGSVVVGGGAVLFVTPSSGFRLQTAAELFPAPLSYLGDGATIARRDQLRFRGLVGYLVEMR